MNAVTLSRFIAAAFVCAGLFLMVSTVWVEWRRRKDEA